MGWVLLALPLGYGGFLAWQEWVYHQSLSAVQVLAPLDSAPSPPAPVQFKPDAIASVLGLNTQLAWVQSAEPLHCGPALSPQRAPRKRCWRVLKAHSSTQKVSVCPAAVFYAALRQAMWCCGATVAKNG